MSTTVILFGVGVGGGDLSFIKAWDGALIKCSHVIPQNAFSSLAIPERHMTCFHFCQSTYFKISFFVQGHSFVIYLIY